jgi:hypothetical protein
VYMLCIETSKILQTQQQRLRQLQWTNGEANLDTDFSRLAGECCVSAWKIIQQNNTDYNNIDITCNNPDITILFEYPDHSQVVKKIELKSSKRGKMPGSTIKSLNINQPLIFCLRPNNDTKMYKIRCGQYHIAMGDSNCDLFQDRTPRPCINFNKMTDIDSSKPYEHKEKNYWIDHYAKCALHRIDNNTNISSWQDDMVRKMKQKIIQDYLASNTLDQIQLHKVEVQMSNCKISFI